MQIAIIADDLTGANDSGVQLAKRGYRTAVMMGAGNSTLEEQDVVVFDTDSRSKSEQEAYRIVREKAEWIKNHNCKMVFKKIDSTMRGNIGIEINAVYDVFLPEFVIIAPAFPQNKRQVIQGYHYVEGQLLHETEVSRDPITPVTASYLPQMLQEQTGKPVALVTHHDLDAGREFLLDKLAELRSKGIAYVVFDSVEDAHLKLIVDTVESSGATAVWVGSAGLASHLPLQPQHKLQQISSTEIPKSIEIRKPVLMVVGSVSRKARDQLTEVLADPSVVGVEMVSSLVAASPAERNQEVRRVYKEAHQAVQAGHHVVVYCTGEPADVEEIARIGQTLNLSPAELGDRIASALGDVSSQLVKELGLDGVVLTGGDTAKQFCRYAHIREFILMDEVESGIPIGYLKGEKALYAVTKAGSFGSNEALLKALHYMRKEVTA